MIALRLAEAMEQKGPHIRSNLLPWARQCFRKYPWRIADKSPYEVLVAEVLLKRTTATAAAKAYVGFLVKYPTLLHLATASEEELTEALGSVGLQQQRAKAMAQLARYLMENENGTVPSCLERLLKVPGLGDYSARAILTFGFGAPVAVLDANVERVVHRVFWKAMPTTPSRSLLQRAADALLPGEGHREFNFGLLDLGALVCRYVDPRCEQCPLNRLCDFYATGHSNRLMATPTHRLRDVRLAKGMGLAQLAKEAGVSKLTIIRIEAGRTTPQPKTIHKLAAALEVTPEELGILG